MSPTTVPATVVPTSGTRIIDLDIGVPITDPDLKVSLEGMRLSDQPHREAFIEYGGDPDVLFVDVPEGVLSSASNERRKSTLRSEYLYSFQAKAGSTLDDVYDTVKARAVAEFPSFTVTEESESTETTDMRIVGLTQDSTVTNPDAEPPPNFALRVDQAAANPSLFTLFVVSILPTARPVAIPARVEALTGPFAQTLDVTIDGPAGYLAARDLQDVAGTAMYTGASDATYLVDGSFGDAYRDLKLQLLAMGAEHKARPNRDGYQHAVFWLPDGDPSGVSGVTLSTYLGPLTVKVIMDPAVLSGTSESTAPFGV